MDNSFKPKLRRVQVSSTRWRGQSMVVLQDPLGISESAAVLPQSIAPVLELCDGTRDVPTIRAALQLRAGLELGTEYLGKIISELDEALFLESDTFYRAYAKALADFRAAPCRPARLAGKVYPADPGELERELQYYASESAAGDQVEGCGQVRGLLSPHIDFKRGGVVYAGVWRKAASAAQEAELVIILGTNHFESQWPLTLTRQSYSTPTGKLGTPVDIVDRLAAALGEEVFRDEFLHLVEHSVELAAVWLHHVLGNRSSQLLPVLCGSFQKFLDTGSDPASDDRIGRFVEVLGDAMAGRRSLVVAAGDLAHMGPAFGDTFPIGPVEKARLSQADSELLSVVAGGNPETMFSLVKEERDRRRICGLAPIYLTMRLLGEAKGQVVSYAQCPADEHGTSFVSICGMLFE